MLYSVALLRFIAWGGSLSDCSGDCSNEVRGVSGYIGVFAGKKQKQNAAHIVDHKRITASHKKSKPLKLIILVHLFV